MWEMDEVADMDREGVDTGFVMTASRTSSTLQNLSKKASKK